MAQSDERLNQLYKAAAIVAISGICYYYVDYIFSAIVLSCAVYAGVTYFLHPPAPKTIEASGKAILITGCDSGFGYELAERAHKLGFAVFAGCYNAMSEGPMELRCSYEERMHVLQMDVTKDHEVNEAVAYVRERCRSTGLWALVNNAGIDGSGPVELCSLNFYKEVCDVNLFGMIRVTRAFLPLVRLAKGRVINMSSERGLLARGGQSTYCISKYGVEAFSDSLRQEMKQFGVEVSIIEPGHFGGATSILDEHTIEAFRKRFAEGYESASAEVKSVYPSNIVDELVNVKKRAVADSPDKSDPVMDIMVKQLIEENIKTRYLIGGTKKIVDPRVVYITLKQFLPDKLLDYMMSKYPV